MPTPGENEAKSDFVSRCIPIVLEDGTAEGQDQAVAVCNSMWRRVQEKGIDPSRVTIGEFKAAMTDVLVPITLETRTGVLPFDEETVISIGGAVKALGDGRTAGWLVEFTDPSRPDLERDYFDATTEYGPHKTSLAFYHHGADKALGRKALAHAARLAVKDTGVWMEHQLDLRDEYEAAIYDLAEQGKLGLSSGTAPHLVEREQKGEVYHITRWPLGLDASYTPTPANWQSRVMPLKSYIKAVGSVALQPGDVSIPQEPSTIQDGDPKGAEASGEAVARRRGLGQAEVLVFELSAILEE